MGTDTIRTYVCVYECMYGASRHRFGYLCMDSSWINSRRAFFTLQFCKCDFSKRIIARGLKLLSACGEQWENLK